ncbi:amidohydrolase [Lentzea sp. JNUCC 0626]|uniref:amidohydrolase n=1 Tax=Lentzea sp. JNUCC 0626 TaxID=3367513 RepID=UPI00374A4056
MSYQLNRRKVLQAFGAAGAASAAAMYAADPVLGATLGYDESIGVDPATYAAPTGIAKDSAGKTTALNWLRDHGGEVTGLSDRIWQHAELSLREWNSAWDSAELLKRHGFTIEWGTGGFPAAFTATYGSGKPVLGFNAEYDALPGLSQKKGVATHDPLVYNYDAYGPTYGAGHGDAHNVLGAGSIGAAIAVSKAMKQDNLTGTLKVYGSSGEEQLVGKAFSAKAGVYNGLDAYLDWHPLTSTLADWGTTAALMSATFTFLGAAGHGGTPLGNKSGLDGALLMATMSEYLREKNVAPSGRFHYAIINGGGAPNVTPDMCSIWFFVREGSPARAQVLYDKIVECAKAAAQASQTRLVHKFHSGTWNSLGNKVAAEVLNDNMVKIGPPAFTAADHDLAKGLQRALGRPEAGMSTTLVPLTAPAPVYLGGPSTDAADVSWQAPKVTALVATFPIGVPHHNWAVSAVASTNIGHQAALSAARYLAATSIDLLTQPDLLKRMKDEFVARTAPAQWKSMIPDGIQQPLYQPPADFLSRTGQTFPPAGITWPVPQVITQEHLGTTGPTLPPVS